MLHNHPRGVLTVVVVDDDQVDREHLIRTLRKAPDTFVVRSATCIEGALELLGDDVDCLIVDHQLPGIDGLTGVEMLAKRQPYLPIILVTGHGDEALARDALRRGAADYLPKTQIDSCSLERIVTREVELAGLRRERDERFDELERFAQVLAHDLDAPARNLCRYAEFVEQDLAAGKLEDAREDAAQLISIAQRMRALVRTTHDYACVTRDVPFGAVSMKGVLEAVRANLHDALASSGAQLHCGGLPVVRGNEELLVQLLQNLIANAIKYCRADPPRIDVSAVEFDGLWHFQVSDNGIGVPKECQETIFEPCRRLHGDGEFSGSGLGLATCRRIVARHQGRIWCETRPGGGSTFQFTLPGEPFEAPSGRGFGFVDLDRSVGLA